MGPCLHGIRVTECDRNHVLRSKTPSQYPVTVIVSGLLVIPPDAAVTVIVPSAPVLPVGETTPAETVAICVLLEVHWATLVISTTPLQVFAFACSVRLVVPPLLMVVPLVEVTVMELIQPTVTVTV